MSEPLIFVRAIHIAATVIAAGTITFVVLVAEPGLILSKPRFATLRRRLNAIIWGALSIAAVSGFVWLAILTADIFGETFLAACLHGGMGAVLTGTRFGAVWTARMGMGLLLALLIFWPATRYFQLLIAGALLAALAFVSHAGARPDAAGELHVLSDAVHLLAAGCWLGALPALAFVLFTVERAEPIARVVKRFSTLAVASVTALAATGLLNSWALLGGPRDLWTTAYGRTLALKLGLFVAMLGIAAVNRFHLTPRLARPGVRRTLARNSLAETALGLGVLFLVGVLGTMPPTAHPPTQASRGTPESAFVHIHTGEVMADVTVTPGQARQADAIIRLLREDSTEFPAQDVTFTAELPGQRATSISRAAVRHDDGSWHASRINFGQPGNWTVRIIIGRERQPSLVLDGPIVISGDAQ